MNANQRKVLNEAVAALNTAADLIRDVGGEEDDKFNNLSEGLQQSERGQRMEEVARDLIDAADELDGIISRVEEAQC